MSKEETFPMIPSSSIGLSTDILSRATPKLRPFENGTATDFGSQLRKAVEEVAKSQNDADSAMKSFESGDEVDVTKVMLAREKASIAFEATLQVRNKLLSAYKDITSMPV
jgi:flagellar hook-basal body complex protein FliE